MLLRIKMSLNTTISVLVNKITKLNNSIVIVYSCRYRILQLKQFELKWSVETEENVALLRSLSGA